MSPFEQLVIYLASLNLSPWLFLKVLYLAGLLIYLAFAVIVIRQVRVMSRTLDDPFCLFLQLLTWIHLLLAIGAFLLALIIL